MSARSPRLAAPFVVVLMVIAMVPLAMAQTPGLTTNQAVTKVNDVTVVASSGSNQFVGAVAGGSSLFIGLLNGTILKLDPLTGQVAGSLVTPDGNSAAHLTFYNGSLYVGTEYLTGAKDRTPYHVYRIDPGAMKVLAVASMSTGVANGYVFVLHGHLWAGDGHCSLLKINPNSLQLEGIVPRVAEDEMVFDGTYYWTECIDQVHVLLPQRGMPVEVANGILGSPNRPRGFFTIGHAVYASGTQDFALYAMSTQKGQVLFNKIGSLSNTGFMSRDTFQYGRLVYAYETRGYGDTGRSASRILVLTLDLKPKTVVPLPGPALPSDATQHSLFAFQGRLYFVTASSVGYVGFVVLQGRENTPLGGGSTPILGHRGLGGGVHLQGPKGSAYQTMGSSPPTPHRSHWRRSLGS